ncbi:MAG: carboxypeptidase regulatory-like domain-containing protein, partial [Treponema sp.]|nr:carboxypeptidase regulatory-like domain-containing protein [Treponema sp.]
MKKFFRVTSILLLLVSLIGCPKDPKVTEQTGDLVGRVIFENENVTDFSNIFVTLSSKTDSGKVWNYTTDASGDFEFNKIPVGDYSVSAMSNASGNRRASTNVKILAKQTVTITDDLKLIAVGSISGKITIDGSANDVFGLDVFIAGKSYNAKVAEDGSYEISDIPAKEGYAVCVQKGEYIKEICKVDVQSENSTTVDYDIKSTDIKKNNSFNWLGELKSAPETRNLYDAYYNETDGCSYIWNGEKWTLLAKAGLNGINGADGAKGEQGLPGV